MNKQNTQYIPKNALVYIFNFDTIEDLNECINKPEFKNLSNNLVNFMMDNNASPRKFTNPKI